MDKQGRTIMEFVYDLVMEKNEAIYKDVPVYDASALAFGELVMLDSADPDSAGGHGVAFITAYTAANTEAIDALGIMQEANSAPTTLPDAGEEYSLAIVNPFAVYRAEYSQSTTMVVASTSTTTITVTNLEDDIDCGWVYMVAGGTGATGNTRALRFLTAAAAGSATMDSALGTTESGGDGTAIKILPVNHRLTALTTDSLKLLTAAAAGAGVSIHIVENFISPGGMGLTPLRYSTHKATTQASGTKFYADIVLLDHVYNNA